MPQQWLWTRFRQLYLLPLHNWPFFGGILGLPQLLRALMLVLSWVVICQQKIMHVCRHLHWRSFVNHNWIHIFDCLLFAFSYIFFDGAYFPFLDQEGGMSHLTKKLDPVDGFFVYGFKWACLEPNQHIECQKRKRLSSTPQQHWPCLVYWAYPHSKLYRFVVDILHCHERQVLMEVYWPSACCACVHSPKRTWVLFVPGHHDRWPMDLWRIRWSSIPWAAHQGVAYQVRIFLLETRALTFALLPLPRV